jgi:uncharacterized protein YsxB (DUF464 family)
MLEVEVRRDSRERLSSLFGKGHTGWAESGDDVVCAAVSAILQAAWLGLEQVADVRVDSEKGEGTLLLRWPAEARDDPALTAIVRTAELSVEQIARQYPAHVRLSRETEA